MRVFITILQTFDFSYKICFPNENRIDHSLHFFRFIITVIINFYTKYRNKQRNKNNKQHTQQMPFYATQNFYDDLHFLYSTLMMLICLLKELFVVKFLQNKKKERKNCLISTMHSHLFLFIKTDQLTPKMMKTGYWLNEYATLRFR